MAILTVLIPALLEIVRAFVRPVYGRKEYGAVAEFLGWLPNYLAGLGSVFVALLAIVVFLELMKKAMPKKFLIAAVALAALLAFAGLCLHEITQRGTGLYYDVQDIYATAGGVLTGLMAAVVVLGKYEFNDLSS